MSLERLYSFLKSQCNSSGLGSLLGEPLGFLYKQKPPTWIGMTEKGLMETDRNNLERNHLFKDEDNLEGLHLEVAYTCLCISEGDFLLWRVLPIAFWIHQARALLASVSLDHPHKQHDTVGRGDCAEIRANVHAVAEPGVLFRAIWWTLISPCLIKLSGGTWGPKGERAI